jgi:hypothetical protein
MTYTTNIEFTADMLASARRIGEATIGLPKGRISPDAFRAIMREERERWGDDVFEVVKARGLIGATGGRA